MAFKKPQLEPETKSKSENFAILNEIVKAQKVIVSYKWVDPLTKKALGGGAMQLMLQEMATHAHGVEWAVKPGHTSLASASGVNRRYIPGLLRAAVAAGILHDPGIVDKQYRTDVYKMSVKQVGFFVYMATMSEEEKKALSEAITFAPVGPDTCEDCNIRRKAPGEKLCSTCLESEQFVIQDVSDTDGLS